MTSPWDIGSWTKGSSHVFAVRLQVNLSLAVVPSTLFSKKRGLLVSSSSGLTDLESEVKIDLNELFDVSRKPSQHHMSDLNMGRRLIPHIVGRCAAR